MWDCMKVFLSYKSSQVYVDANTWLIHLNLNMWFFVQYRLSAIIKQFSVSEEATAFYCFHKHRHAAGKKEKSFKTGFHWTFGLVWSKIAVFQYLGHTEQRSIWDGHATPGQGLSKWGWSTLFLLPTGL